MSHTHTPGGGDHLLDRYPGWDPSEKSMETRLLDPGLAYPRPWFYGNPWALRCELGQGDDVRTFLASAQARAEAIAAILFRDGQPDAVFADMVMTPNGTPWCKIDRKRHRALTARYRSFTVEKIAPGPFDDEENALRSRFFFWRDEDTFDVSAIIAACFDEQASTLHLLSRTADCALSIYDSRGCDIVFANPRAMLQYYHVLSPYFLDYDRAEMEARRCAAEAT